LGSEKADCSLGTIGLFRAKEQIEWFLQRGKFTGIGPLQSVLDTSRSCWHLCIIANARILPEVFSNIFELFQATNFFPA
jgi:hypothetical protein